MCASYLIKALDNQNYSEALSIISYEDFFDSLNAQNLHLIKSRILSAQSSKYPTPLKLLALSLVIINDVKLEPREQKLCVEYLLETLQTSAYKQMCAGMLVRLPNFQNKHTVLAHLHPNTIPLNLMVDVVANIKNNKPSLLQKHLFKFREEWVLLLNGYQLSFQRLKQILEQYKVVKEGSEYQLMKKAESEINFMILRIRNMHNQKINLDVFSQTVESLIQVKENDNIHLSLSTTICQFLQSSGYKLVNELVLKVQKRLIRKYEWLLKIVNFGLKKLHDYSQFTIRIISLIHTVQKVFGNGALEMQKIIFIDKQALVILLENLLVQSDDNKFFTIQTPALSHGKMKNVSELSVKATHDPYPDFVKQVNKRHRNELIGIILQIIKQFYSEPHQSTHISKLSDILDEYYHKMSMQNKEYTNQIKLLMFPKSLVYSPGLEQVFEEIIIGGAMDQITKRRKIDYPVSQKTETKQRETNEMRLIESKHVPRKINDLNQSEYFSCTQNNVVSTFKDPMKISKMKFNPLKDSYYSFKDQSEIFYSCISKPVIQQSLHQSFYSIPYQKQENEDSLEHPLPLQATQRMSKISFMKNQSIHNEQIDRISEKIDEQEEGGKKNPIEIIDDQDNDSISQVVFE